MMSFLNRVSLFILAFSPFVSCQVASNTTDMINDATALEQMPEATDLNQVKMIENFNTETTDIKPNPFHITPNLQSEIHAGLLKECGTTCVDYWEQIQNQYSANDTKITLNEMLVNEMNGLIGKFKAYTDEKKDFVEEQKSALQTYSEQKESFLGSESGIVFPETPCGGGKSCAALELIANRCNYQRLATMAVYQSFNLVVHTFAIVAKFTCLCADVGTLSLCFLERVPIYPCEHVKSVYGQTLSGATELWQTVKSQTNQCKVIGDVRAQLSPGL